MNNQVKCVLTSIVSIVLTVCPLAGATGNTGNELRHDHEDIMLQAKSFIEADLDQHSGSANILVKPLDNRLQLHACTKTLNLFWPPGARKSGHTSIGVRCNDHKPWKIFIGVQIQQIVDVWVTKTAIDRDTVIDSSHVTLMKRDISQTASQYIPSSQSPVGLVAKRPLRAGDVVQLSTLAKQKNIKRGDRVLVIARKNGLEIRTFATALTDGATGERIQVRNISSEKVLEGVLDENRVVNVNI